MSFNTSTRKDDVSVKLKAQNIKHARDMTRQLELENQRMEQRLNELKMAMRKDREERGYSGGFWGKGQQGSLGKYAAEVLNQTSASSSAKSDRSSGKKKKFKVLKDEPIATPEKRVQPGSYGNIAMRDAYPQPKVKGPKCGQCEQKVAHVSCHECGEDYCAACFAAFHLKGALRRHRSIPIGSNGAITARSSSRQSYIDGSGASGDEPGYSSRALYSEADISVLPANGRTPSPQGHNGPSLLNGTYDEREAQASFQQALAEWRSGKTQNDTSRETHRPQASSRIPALSVNKQVSITEHGTSTDGLPSDKKPLEINFTSNLTYAEKLLLKKHRREQLSEMPACSVLDSSCASQLSHSSLHHDHHDFDDEALDAEVQRVSFQALANAVREPGGMEADDDGEDDVELRPESHVSVVEVNLSQVQRSLRGYEHSSNYHVSELLDDDTALRSQPKLHSPHTKDAFMTPSPPPSAKRRSPTIRHRVKSPQLPSQTPVVQFNPSSVPPSPDAASLKMRNQVHGNIRTGSPRKHTDHKTPSIRENVDLTGLVINSGEVTDRRSKPPPRPNSQVKKGQSLSKSSTSLRDCNDLDLSLEGHPLDSSRSHRSKPVTSRPQSRSASKAASRPVSRARSRASLASIFGEGTLTKAPSSSLREVAGLANKMNVPEYTSGLGEFLVAGVAMQQEERTLTPSGKRSRPSSATTDKWKVSYKLYNMGPRSWRPDSSLGSAVDPVSADPLHDLTLPEMADPELEREARVAFSFHQPPAQRKAAVLSSQDEVVMDLDTPRATPIPASLKLNLNRMPRDSPRETPRNVTFRANSPPSRMASERSRPHTPSTTKQRPGTPGRPKTPVVMDGQDLSQFDEDRASSRQEQEAADVQALDQLEWELASQTGRLDADGNISRMELSSSPQDMDYGANNTSSTDKPYDFNNQLRASVLMDDFDEMEQKLMEEEVKALK